MLGLYNYIANSKAVQSIVRGGLQLFYKADRTQAPLGEEQIRNNSFDEITDNLVSNPTFDLGSEEVQNRLFDELGSELVLDTNFTAGNDFWSFESGITKVGGKAVFNTDADNTGIYRQTITTDGKTYKAQIEITDYTSGAVQFNYNGNFIGSFDTVGVHTAYFVAGGNNLFGIQSDGTADLSLGSSSLKQVDPNNRWTVGPSAAIATFGDGFVDIFKETGADSTDAYIYQDILENNKTYQVTFSGVINEGVLFFGTNAVDTNEFAAGTYENETFNFTTTSTDNFIIRNPNTGTTIDARITSVSVKEIPNWVPGSAWSFNDGLAIGTYASSTPGQLSQAGFLTAGKSYSVSVTIDSIASGKSLKVALGSGGSELVFSNVGTTTLIGTAASNEILYLFGNESGFSATISNISVKQLDPNNRWTLEAGWSINNGKATYNSSITDNLIRQTLSITIGATYKLQFTVEDYVSGTLDAALSDGSLGSNSIAANGTYSFDIIATGTLCAFRSTDRFDGSISNVSVKEITNSIKDYSRNSNDGILYSGKALDFDGTGDSVDVGDTGINMKTVAFWIFVADVTSNTEQIMEFKTDHGISSVNGTITTAGTFTNEVIYVNGSAGSSISASTWSRIVITTTAAIDVNQLVFGTDGSSSGTFVISDFQLYDKTWNATDVEFDYNNPDKDVFDRVGEAQVLGEEEVVNTDFATPQSDWSFANGWGLNNNTAVYDGTGAQYAKLVQPLTTVAGSAYQVTFTLNEISKSSVKFGLATSANSFLSDAAQFTTPGTHTITMTATASDNRIVLQVNSATMTCTVSNVSVQEVTTHASHILPTDCKSLLRLNEGAGDRVYDAAPVLGAEEVQNGAFNLGSEKVQNGDFSDGTTFGWSFVNLTADISNNTLKLTSTTSADNRAFYDISTEIGKTYQMSVDVKSSASNSEAGIGGIGTTNPTNFQDGANADSFTTLKFVFTATLETTQIRLLNSKAGVWGGLGSIAEFDNVSVKEVLNWTTFGNVNISDSKANFTSGADSYVLQNILDVGKSYQISADYNVTSISSNSYFGTNGNPAANVSLVGLSGVGTITATIIAENTNLIFRSSNFNGSVTNISVKEIKPAESFAIVGDKNFLHQQPHIPQYAMSSFSKKMIFDGSNDYVACGSDASIDDIFTGGGTFSAWISPTTDGGSNLGTIMGKGPVSIRVKDDDNDGVILNLGKGFSTTNADFLTSDEVVLENKMNHIAITYDDSSSSNTPSFYVNGVLTAIDTDNSTTPAGSASTDASSDLIIGNVSAGGARSFDGIIDEVSLFKTILTQAEVVELFNSGSSFDSTGHSKYNLGEEVSNGTFELGSEEVVNGDYSNGLTGWTPQIPIGQVVEVVNNQLHIDYDASETQASTGVNQTILVANKTYQIEVDIESITGTIRIQAGGVVNDFNTAGVKTFTVVPSSTILHIIRSNDGNNVDAVLNSISVKEIPNWSSSTASSATISVNTSGQLEITDASNSEYLGAYTPISLVEGRTYVLSIDIISSNKLSQIRIGTADSFNPIGQDTTIHDASGTAVPVGTNTYIFTANSNDASRNFLYIGGRDDVNSLVIDNVSLQEYGLSAYWRNNGADQWDDLSINSNHGTVSGSPTEIFLQEVPFFGKDSLGMFMNKPRLGGLNFNGSGYVANQGMPTISDNISFSFWIKLEDFVTGNIAQVVGKRTNSDSKWCRVYRPSANSLRLEVAASDQLGFTIQEAEWVHVAITIDGRAAKAYVNGALTAQATLSGDFNFLSANDFSVGSWKDTATSTSNNSLLNGVVDDVMVYDETLTLKQVTKNYNATKGKHKN